jgi:hypothetical protein
VVPHQEVVSVVDLVAVVVGAVEASVVEDAEDSVEDEADSTTGLEGLAIEVEEGSVTGDLGALVTAVHPAAIAAVTVVEDSEVVPVEVGSVIGEVPPEASVVGKTTAHQAVDSGSCISLFVSSSLTYLVL